MPADRYSEVYALKQLGRQSIEPPVRLPGRTRARKML